MITPPSHSEVQALRMASLNRCLHHNNGESQYYSIMICLCTVRTSCLEVGLTKMAPGMGKQRPALAHSISTTGAGITWGDFINDTQQIIPRRFYKCRKAPKLHRIAKSSQSGKTHPNIDFNSDHGLTCRTPIPSSVFGQDQRELVYLGGWILLNNLLID